MKCDTIADGIVEAAGEVGINVPLVVRLEGTNVEAGREILSGSGLDIQTGADMKEAASYSFGWMFLYRAWFYCRFFLTEFRENTDFFNLPKSCVLLYRVIEK